MQTNPILSSVESVAFMAALVAYLVSAALYFIYGGTRRDWARPPAWCCWLAL